MENVLAIYACGRGDWFKVVTLQELNRYKAMDFIEMDSRLRHITCCNKKSKVILTLRKEKETVNGSSPEVDAGLRSFLIQYRCFEILQIDSDKIKQCCIVFHCQINCEGQYMLKVQDHDPN